MKNKFRLVGFILIVFAFLLIITGFILNINNDDSRKTKLAGNDSSYVGNNSLDFVVVNNYNECTVEQQIALILSSDYLRSQAIIDNLKTVNYSDGEFSFTYIVKKGENEFKNDEIYVTTKDFVSYSMTSTKYEGEKPDSISLSGYDIFLYTTKNMVYDLAKSNNYMVGKTLTGEQMTAILDILKKSDVGKFIKKAESSGYKLTKYSSLPNDKITFTFEKSDGSYLDVYNVISDIKRWNIYGVDSTQLSSDYTYLDFISGYVIDKTVSVDDSSYNGLNEQIGNFFE